MKIYDVHGLHVCDEHAILPQNASNADDYCENLFTVTIGGDFTPEWGDILFLLLCALQWMDTNLWWVVLHHSYYKEQLCSSLSEISFKGYLLLWGPVYQVEEKAREGRVRLDDEDGGGEGDDGEGGKGDPHANLRRRLHKQVVVLDREINAVADGVYGDGKQMLEEEEEEVVEESVKKSASLHRALADDRLRSLLRKRRQLKEQLKALDVEDDNALKSLVQDIIPVLKIKKGKKQEKEEVMVPSNSGKDLGSVNAKKKVVCLVEDNNVFDAALDSAATGFTETVSMCFFVHASFMVCNFFHGLGTL